MKTISQFVAENQITMETSQVESNPHMANQDWPARHFFCTLRRGTMKMATYYSAGLAITGEPDVADVLNCLASDVPGVDQIPSFEEWAGELGYNPDSRRDERVYRAVIKSTKNLRRFLGEDLFRSLIEDTERL